ncbi:MAG: DEAD/DEAH box helicase family protein, partial [Candidatus Methanomethylophilaceae archaeon]|nr:DEAD/DEAH box helicase family protein [Candidatus Methanomethylophilaceae archaeon]
MAYFCIKCNSLMPPGTDRCKICGALLDGAVSKQKSLTELGSFVKQPKVISKDEMKAPYLPYEPRPLQLQIISEIRDTLDSGKHIVMESGTGTGKTIISLAAALEHAVPRGK